MDKSSVKISGLLTYSMYRTTPRLNELGPRIAARRRNGICQDCGAVSGEKHRNRCPAWIAIFERVDIYREEARRQAG